MLHQAVRSDSFYSEDFAKIVKGLGKDWLVECIFYNINAIKLMFISIEEKDKEGLTPMMLAASLNKSRKLRMIFHAYLG